MDLFCLTVIVLSVMATYRTVGTVSTPDGMDLSHDRLQDLYVLCRSKRRQTLKMLEEHRK
jgi:hypothetical protein